MKSTPQELVDLIVELKNQGLSSRQIAEALDIGKSTVNDVYNREVSSIIEAEIAASEAEIAPTRTPRIAVVDVETSAAKVYCFGRFKQNIGQANVSEEGGKILVGCWRWLGEDTVHSAYMTPKEIAAGNDNNVVRALYKVYEEADAVIMHNAKNFDHKVIQTRGIANGGGTLPPTKVIDTLEMAKRKMRLPSNRLDSIGAYFNLGRKQDNSGIRLWIDVQEGNEEKMQEMVQYCQQDVNLLYDVYMKLRCLGHAGTNFNAGHYYEDAQVHCKVCGSSDLVLTEKKVYTALQEFNEIVCLSCGASQRTRINLTTKEKKELLLS